MSGHSKWATTKHKKAAIDAKRGKLFARLIKNIEVAARTGGGDTAGNPPARSSVVRERNPEARTGRTSPTKATVRPGWPSW